jgi:hypothetical protein
MISLKDFTSTLIKKLTSAITIKNVSTILSRMIESGCCNIYKTSKDRNEYKKLSRTLSGDNSMSDISPATVNATLMEQASVILGDSPRVYVIHDPSDIRKPYSSDTENLGQVRDLNGKIINGYSSHNAIAFIPIDQKILPLSHVSYSNKDPKFLKQEIIKKIKNGKDFEGQTEATDLYNSGDYFNKKTLTTTEITRISNGLKRDNMSLEITHVLDREFDDDDYLKLISETLSDFYVIRAKKSRTLDTKGDDGKKSKLINSTFTGREEKPFQKLKFKKKHIQDGKFIVEWCTYNKSNAVKITVIDREGNEVFEVPMLLLTNKPVNNLLEAFDIYMDYLKRSKIEYVFKFLKEGMGWEDIQIRNYKGIQNLLSLCFYMSAYLYLIGNESTFDDYSILFSEIGGGKGKVTRHFILKGIMVLMAKYKVDEIFKEKKITSRKQERLRGIISV